MTEEEKINQEETVVNDSVADEETVKEATKEAEEPAEEKDPLEAAKAEIEELKTQILYNVLPVIDDMERAIENGAKTDDPAVLREGMELIYNKFIKALEGLGVKKMDTTDADFDTDLHEAVAMVPGMGDDKKGKVIDCLQTGYMLNWC